MKIHNPARVTAVAWVLITILAIFGVFAPFIFGVNGEDGGFAISFLCLLLVLTGIIVVVVYLRRARELDKMLNGENVLANWTYSEKEWSQYTEGEHRRDIFGKRTLFFITAGFCVVIGIGFFIADPDSGRWVLVAMLALIAFVGLVAWITTTYNYRQNKRSSDGVRIAPYGLYLNRQLHLWNQLGAKLESVIYMEEPHPYISFAYLAPTRTGIQKYTAHVPVPQGKETEAKNLVVKFNTEIIKAF